MTILSRDNRMSRVNFRKCCVLAATGIAVLCGQITLGQVINIPPDPNIPDGGSIGSGLTVNLFANGEIGESVDAGNPNGTSTDIEVNIMGGFVGNEFAAHSGSEINISGGFVGNNFESNGTSVVNVSGGTVGSGFAANAGSLVNVSGGRVGNDFVATESTVNISGGEVGNDYLALTNSYLHVSGGRLGYFLNAGAADGTSANVDVLVSGGIVGGGVEANGGSTVEFTGGRIVTVSSYGINFNAFSIGYIRGGVVDQAFDTFTDSDVHIYGADFFLEDDPVSDGPISIPEGEILYGILSDGTPFALGTPLDDDTTPDTLTLHTVTVAPPGPAKITVPTDTPPPSIRGGQMLTVNAGGMVPESFRAGPGSMITINGGSIGGDLQVRGTTVNVAGGSIGGDFVALSGSVVNVTGGTVGSFMEARRSEVNISGGMIGTGFRGGEGSHVEISGGIIGDFFRFESEAETSVEVSGGVFVGGFGPTPTTTVDVFGGDFRFNGQPVDGLNNPGDTAVVSFGLGAELTGTLADGTPFSFARGDDFLNGGSATLHLAVLPPIGPAEINVPGGTLPPGIRAGQTLTVGPGGSVGGTFGSANFVAGDGSTVNVEGGTVGYGLEAIGATVNVRSGSIGSSMRLFDGAVLNVSGGTVGSGLKVRDNTLVSISAGEILGSSFGNSIEMLLGAEVNVTGGTVGEGLSVAGAELNFSGGTIGPRLFVSRDFPTSTPGVVNVSGGTFAGSVQVSSGGKFNLLGTEFFLDGVEIPGLNLDEPFTVTDRNVTLSGLLADGSPFSFDLTTQIAFNQDYFHPTDSVVTVTLVEPTALVADLDGDGDVDGADFLLIQRNDPSLIAAWRLEYGAGAPTQASSAAIPEPTTFILFTVGGLLAALRLRA